jgi:hypothetical protein
MATTSLEDVNEVFEISCYILTTISNGSIYVILRGKYLSLPVRKQTAPAETNLIVKQSRSS